MADGDGEFDDVICSLVLHYVEDWEATLKELHRVLRPHGRLVISIIHPFVYAFSYPDQDYFALTQYSEDYDFRGETITMTYWHRPLQEVLNLMIDAGWRCSMPITGMPPMAAISIRPTMPRP